MFCAYTRPRYQVSVCRPIGPLVQKRFPDDVSSLHRLCIASTSCTRPNIATTKEKLKISIIRKKMVTPCSCLGFHCLKCFYMLRILFRVGQQSCYVIS